MLVEINDTDILVAEEILFGKTGIFSICEGDSEETIVSKNQRREFIKDLRRLDLRAVPGSGKTTALLAKLLILESKLPFEDGSGILVLSHTNAAVDEIKRKIEHHCSKLFHYPNFVGTIQSFVDQFLAIPFYRNSFLLGSLEIGNERYFSQYSNSFPFNLNKFCKCNCIKSEFKTLLKRYYNAHKPRTYELFFGLTSKDLIKENGSIPEFKIPKESKKRLNLSGRFSDEEKELFGNYYKKLAIYCKADLLRCWGLIPYRDAYSFANILKNNYPEIIEFLQKRFKIVFVDEMQDMDKHQVDLLEKLFYDDGKSICIYQRIGDINQAIHNDIDSDDCWEKRNPTLEFTGSHRLNPFTAKIVQPFGLYPMELQGLANSDVDFVIPHLIVYDDPKEVLPRFENLIKENKLPQVNTNEKYPFQAIGWVGPYKLFTEGKHKGETDYSKHVIQSFFEDFKKESETLRTDFNCLEDYLIHFNTEDKTLASIQKNILNSIVKALREADILDELSQRPFSVTSFLKYFKEKEGNEDAYRELKLKLYDWSFSIINQRDKCNEIEAYIRFLIETHFGRNINDRVIAFLSKDSERQDKIKTKEESEFIFTGDNGIKVKLGTIHSVKGETHVATLVFDTFYYGYNSTQLPNPFRGEIHDIKMKKNKDIRKKQTAKMLYVAFSRPTHLLCFAINKDRYNEVFRYIKPIYWEDNLSNIKK